MKLVVGLGNPGKEYESTRHNVGFMAIDSYLGDVQFKEKDNSLYYEMNINGEKVIFLKPITYMNESGVALIKFVKYYKIDIKDILLIYDDMDFEVGFFKLKPCGSAGGHNGVKSVIKYLGTENFNRIRIGISKPKNDDVVNYVLGKFSVEDKDRLNVVLKDINLVLDDYFKLDFDKLMSKYNKR